MLHAFVSERPARPARHLRDVTASVAMHTALIAAAIVATTSPAAVQRATGAVRVAERVLFTAVARPAELIDRPLKASAARAASRHPARIRAKPIATSLPAIDPAAFEMPDLPTLPTPGSELAERATAGLAIPEGGLAEMFAAALARQRRPVADGNGVYTAEVVEKIAAPIAGNPAPLYPSFLLDAGIEGSVDVRFVVDTTGRIREGTLEFPGKPHRLFVSSVKRALLRSRFLPAEVDGHRVAQLVAQRFSFVVAR